MGRLLMSAAMVVVALAVLAPQVAAKRWTVGGNKGWTDNVNYTIWARDKHFYLDDWLFFVYDRNQKSVLEVNKTNYENCNAEHPLHNHTTGAGRDVVHLNVTRHYYFISGGGFCYGGMKLAIRVEKPPPPPKASPVEASHASTTISPATLLLPAAAFAAGILWNAMLGLW